MEKPDDNKIMHDRFRRPYRKHWKQYENLITNSKYYE